MAQDFATLVLWLTSPSADENVAPRCITIQLAGVDDDDSAEPEPQIVAIASVGDEDYIASAPSGSDLVAALDSLGDELSREGGRLAGSERYDEDVE